MGMRTWRMLINGVSLPAEIGGDVKFEKNADSILLSYSAQMQSGDFDVKKLIQPAGKNTIQLMVGLAFMCVLAMNDGGGWRDWICETRDEHHHRTVVTVAHTRLTTCQAHSLARRMPLRSFSRSYLPPPASRANALSRSPASLTAVYGHFSVVDGRWV